MAGPLLSASIKWSDVSADVQGNNFEKHLFLLFFSFLFPLSSMQQFLEMAGPSDTSPLGAPGRELPTIGRVDVFLRGES